MKKFIKIFILVLLVLFVVGVFWVSRVPKTSVKNFGVTFSKTMAEEFGLDWKDVYREIFDDLGISKIRIPVYWQEVEKEEGDFDFSDYDWMLGVAKENNTEVILAVGRKVPRWPECHEPEWFQSQSSNLKSQSLLNYIKTTVERYDSNPAVAAWQVENEPFLPFGICPEYDPYFIDEEIELVRSLSDKSIVVTDGGEFGDWARAYKRADIFGSTMYRHVVTKYIGEWTYPIPSWFFRLRQGFLETFYEKKPRIVIELQTEPWIDGVVKDATVERQYEGFGPERFAEMMEYIKGSGFDTFYFWGVEWWYWLKEQDRPEMWDLVKSQVSNVKSKNL